MKIVLMFLSILFFTIGNCWAQEWDTTHLYVSGREVSLPMGQIAPVSLPVGSQIYLTSNTNVYEKVVTSNLGNPVASEEPDGQGGYNIKVSGVTGNLNETTLIAFQQNGLTAYAVEIQPTDVAATLKAEFQQGSTQPEWMQIAGGVLVGLGMIPLAIVVGGTIFGIVMTIRHLRNVARRNRRWRLN